MKSRKQLKKILILSVKIAVGSSVAVYIAQKFLLDYAASAGTIALLTLMTTKWETVKLSIFRMITFVFTVVTAGLIFPHISSIWIAYGLFIFMLVTVSCVFGWKTTISVNSVIGAHLLTNQDFSITSVCNELALVGIGITIAIILNLFHDNRGRKKDIIEHMRYTENKLQMILGELAAYLSNKEMQRNVWEDICDLEKILQEFIKEAYEYQDNTFHSHPGYFINYFEMRLNQCHVLHNLHYEMKKIKAMPKQSKIVAEYMIYLMDYVVEINIPVSQTEKLNEIFERMKDEELPNTREAFESRAILYHILMDIEEFLVFKMRFVKELNERQIKEYWKK